MYAVREQVKGNSVHEVRAIAGYWKGQVYAVLTLLLGRMFPNLNPLPLVRAQQPYHHAGLPFLWELVCSRNYF